MSVPPVPPLGTQRTGYALITTQQTWDDGPTTVGCYIADSNGNPLLDEQAAVEHGQLLQTVAATPDRAPLIFQVQPLYDLPELPPS